MDEYNKVLKLHHFHIVSVENAFELCSVAAGLLKKIVDDIVAGAVILVFMITYLFIR